MQKDHDEVVALGGLHVVGTERHEARRIDNQLRGRSGRQGDPGSSRFYVSLDDDIMRLFGGEAIAKIMTAFKLPEDTPIEHSMVGHAIENAQIKVESHNFDIRKHLVEYDDVANKQREIIYGMRRDVLEAAQDQKMAQKIREDIRAKIDREIENLVMMHAPEGIQKPEYEKILKELAAIIPFDETSQKKLQEDCQKIESPQKLVQFLKGVVDQVYTNRQSGLGEAVARGIEKFSALSVIDTLWIGHLDSLDDLRDGIGLRAAGQRDPLVEYKQEAFNLFEKLISSIDYEIVHRVFKVQIRQEPTIERIEEQGVEVHPEAKLTSDDQQSAADQQHLRGDVRSMAGEHLGGEGSQGKDPMEMTDQELDAEIARLEELEKSPQPTVDSSQLGTANPYSSVNREQRTINQKIGRNDPCPCGSGLKWKKCGLINDPHHRG